MTLGCAAATQARAESWLQFEAGVGTSAYVRGGDGLWVQDGFQHKVDLTAPAIEAGITGDLLQHEHWGLSYHVDWVWLATIHTQSMATPSDENYNLATKRCNGPCWPLANYIGAGHDMGVMATIEPHYDVGGWRLGVEAGPYLHKSTWSVDVAHWVSSPTATPINLHVENWHRWTLGAVVGASIEHKRFALRYLYFMNGTPSSSANPYPPIWSGTHVLLATYRANLL